jgi:hypothetical protein
MTLGVEGLSTACAQELEPGWLSLSGLRALAGAAGASFFREALPPLTTGPGAWAARAGRLALLARRDCAHSIRYDAVSKRTGECSESSALACAAPRQKWPLDARVRPCYR